MKLCSKCKKEKEMKEFKKGDRELKSCTDCRDKSREYVKTRRIKKEKENNSNDDATDTSMKRCTTCMKKKSITLFMKMYKTGSRQNRELKSCESCREKARIYSRKRRESMSEIKIDNTSKKCTKCMKTKVMEQFMKVNKKGTRELKLCESCREKARKQNIKYYERMRARESCVVELKSDENTDEKTQKTTKKIIKKMCTKCMNIKDIGEYKKGEHVLKTCKKCRGKRVSQYCKKIKSGTMKRFRKIIYGRDHGVDVIDV